MNSFATSTVIDNAGQRNEAAADPRLAQLLERLNEASPEALASVLNHWLETSAPGTSRVDS